ncbi:MAG: nucleotidyl transferase AbiEii/AbiGii toxin family protein [Nannocystaceae bacterium]|nr:nucleotidyl transferase AbiEii/AbiGii toxin family protein [Nannocystaceae bacterium]
MNHLVGSIRRILADLGGTRYRFALVGGLAVSVHIEPRTTRDVDIAVSVLDDAAAESLLRDMMCAGYTVSGVVEQTDTGRLATARMLPPGDGTAIVDLLFASSGIEPELVDAAEPVEILRSTTVPVASLGDLLALKLLARDDETRPQDAGDIRGLVRAATSSDLERARASVALISERGYARGRDLAALLASSIASGRSTRSS